MSVDRKKPITLKYQVYETLKDLFIDQYQPGQIIPTEVDLSKRYDVALGTVRSALDILVKEGIITRRSGKGSFLTKDFFIKFKSYSIGVVLSSTEFTDTKEWECSWVQNIEMINGIMAQARKMNIECKLIPEENVSVNNCKDLDGFLVWGPLSPRLKKVLGSSPSIEMRYDVNIPKGFTSIGQELIRSKVKYPAFIGRENQCRDRLYYVNRELEKSTIEKIDSERISLCEGSERDGYNASIILLEKNIKIDALVCSTDLRALGAILAIKEKGLRIPGDISVYGFDGIQKSELSEPPLTTYSFDWQYPGILAVKQIRSLLDGTIQPEYELPSGELILRKSCKG